MEWLAGLLGSRWRAPAMDSGDAGMQPGTLGGYCRGRSLDECEAAFGLDNLPRMCATCPD
ncbi:MAG: hypothetical protein LLG06_12205 [Desulfobacteraceae bacterium]|nr:hypothetical protein [Desulfobacteraceae bacterium]